MSQVVHILHLEDDPADGELIPATLEAAGYQVHSRPVSSRADFVAALDQGGFDLILADCKLPSFDGLEALALARVKRPETPFLFVSGFIGEEAALESLKHGATDYVFKHNLARLAPAVRRALHEAHEQRERRLAEAAVQEREATLDSFFNTAPYLMGIAEWFPDGLHIVSANAAAARFAGTTSQALHGCRVHDAPEWDWLRQAIARLQESGRGTRLFETEVAHVRDGRTRWLSLTVSPLATPGPVPRFCYVAADITDKKQLEEQFLRAQRLESVGTLASGIAHDLNNVLAPLVMSLRLFRGKLQDPEDVEILATLEASARRGADVIRQVLAFARGAPGAREPVCFTRLLDDLGRMIRETFPRSIQFDIHVASDLKRVTGDATQLYQVLMNLCVNARDAMPDGGRLRVRVENVAPEAATPAPAEPPPGGYVLLTVADTGPGVAPAHLGRIFDPFFTTKPTGTGLGLSTALTLVKAHGGLMTLSNEPGRGAEFKVYLPAQSVPGLDAEEELPATVPRGQGELILLVDDEAAVRRIGQATLADAGYRVLTAGDGAEALRMLVGARNPVGLVVTDMMMPVLNGGRFLRALQEHFPQLPVVAMSGLPENQAGLPEPGRTAFLLKPFTAEQLLIAVHEALARKTSVGPD